MTDNPVEYSRDELFGMLSARVIDGYAENGGFVGYDIGGIGAGGIEAGGGEAEGG